MAGHLTCSECPKSIRGKVRGTKTCSTACRSRRARRLKAAKHKSPTLPPGVAEVTDVVTRKNVRDVAHTVMAEELRPLVREQLTEDVVSGIGKMMALTPTAINALEAQIASPDETISQRAVALLLKYTLGNPSVAPPPAGAAPGGLTVQFNLPRPGDTEPRGVLDGEIRECLDCKTFKPDEVFVAGSDRCQECFDGMSNMLVERFGDVYRK